MVKMETPVCDFGWSAADFDLLGVDNKRYTLKGEMIGAKAFVVMFICNHCPFVKTIISRIVRDISELETQGVKALAICSNDAIEYPDDSFDEMKNFSREHGFTFPYLHDKDQSVAKAYGAVCTPDFFGLDADGKLQYRGRFDSSNMSANSDTDSRDLYKAMGQIATTWKGPEKQYRSIGCSIKWIS